MKSFHFYAAFGKYTEETASSLSEFAQILQTIDAGSIGFHFPRQDFQKWIKDTIGDSELANRIDKIEPTLSIEETRTKLKETVQTRIAELEELSAETNVS